MKVLILGGTVFLGYHVARSALEAGHEVTVFSRGLSKPAGPLPGAERLTGDRDGNLDALGERKWDFVIDTSGYVPRVVRQSVERLTDAVGLYVFVSSISVYDGFREPRKDETHATGTLDDPLTEDVAKAYGPLKASCEEVVREGFPGRALIVRPGLIVGPNDPTDRFTYWPVRLREGGETIAPGLPDAPVQFIDVRDLAEWIVRMAESRRTGTYNATGPAIRTTMKDFLERTNQASGGGAGFEWVDNEFLLANGAGPWMELPLWIPGTGETADARYMLDVDIDRALAEGLTFRPLEETIEATLEWDDARTDGKVRKAGMNAEKEKKILDLWQTKRSNGNQ
ncbi:NAD-dependent epimerase/dehydratase family protein [Cohnella suwonensis]|uniref:NAD-dependent epimerase/dehydratase family protein n=1 Tax=Cohnella suwonensis TaxID=696072 RepID=A0ABW0LP79_9BACL